MNYFLSPCIISELNPSGGKIAIGNRHTFHIAADKKAKGVSIDGCKYPLKNATLERTHQYAISNEIEKNCALVSVRRGGLYILESTESR